jgi:hypothetical protein
MAEKLKPKNEFVLPEMQNSTTVENIIAGKAIFKHLGEDSFTDDRTIGGRNWHGSSYLYEMQVPSPTNPNETMRTEVTVWNPLPVIQSDIYTQKPDTQIFISTGQGEMPFTSDPEVKKAILDEISRQMT